MKRLLVIFLLNSVASAAIIRWLDDCGFFGKCLLTYLKYELYLHYWIKYIHITSCKTTSIFFTEFSRFFYSIFLIFF